MLKILGVSLFFLLSGLTILAQKYPCLPPDLVENSIVNYPPPSVSTSATGRRTVTVKKALAMLKARCLRGKLIDRRRREIRFYHLEGCWGNPPADYLEILERQKKDLERLKKKYTVLEIMCSTDVSSPQAAP